MFKNFLNMLTNKQTKKRALKIYSNFLHLLERQKNLKQNEIYANKDENAHNNFQFWRYKIYKFARKIVQKLTGNVVKMWIQLKCIFLAKKK